MALSLVVGGGGIGAGFLISELFFAPTYRSGDDGVTQTDLRRSVTTYYQVRTGSIVVGAVGFGLVLLASPAVGYFVGTSGSQPIDQE
jgi:hypothetical protein